MADVQCEHGYTKLANELLEVIMRQKLNGTQFKIIMAVWRFTYGFQRKEHDMSLTFLSNATGVHKQQIKTELSKLIDQKIIKVTSESSYTTSRKLAFNKNYDEWEDLQSINTITVSESTYTTVSGNSTTTVSESTYQERNIKEKLKESIPHKEIIEHLNQKTGKNFSFKTKKTRDLISARWNEGKRLNDFIAVIDYFSDKWGHGATFKDGVPAAKYLQPSTLFNGKFDERVNEANANKPKNKVVPINAKEKNRIELQKKLQYLSEQMDLCYWDNEKYSKLEKEFDEIQKELKRIG